MLASIVVPVLSKQDILDGLRAIPPRTTGTSVDHEGLVVDRAAQDDLVILVACQDRGAASCDKAVCRSVS